MGVLILSAGQVVLAGSLGFVAFRLFQTRDEVRDLRRRLE